MRRLGPAENQQHIAESALELILLLSGAHCGAVFRVSEGEPLLVASQDIHQESLAAGMRVWATRRRDLAAGDGVVYLPTGLVVPVGPQDRRGYLYADQPEPGFRFSAEQRSAFAEILGRVLASVADTSSPRPLPAVGLRWSVDQDRAMLASLLEEEEWNIARVARMLGVRRQTIYNRLARYKIVRQRVPKKA